jgi:hypothetical protein
VVRIGGGLQKFFFFYRNYLLGCYEIHISYNCTCRDTEQLNQSPARNDAWLSSGDPRWCAVMAAL